jgi:hypothetical protein
MQMHGFSNYENDIIDMLSCFTAKIKNIPKECCSLSRFSSKLMVGEGS